MNIKEISCTTALSPSRLPGLEYSLNPYRGCAHGCAYCYVPNVLRINRMHWGKFVDVRTNIPVILAKEIKKKKPCVVGISTVTDPYQPIEQKYKLTHYCLEQLLRVDFPISIQTKSSLIVRDIELITRFSNAEVILSIGTLDDTERKVLEPAASPINERLEVLNQCSSTGIQTSVFFGPIYPTITKDDIPDILDTFKASGASKIWIDALNLKPGIWAHIENTTRQHKKMHTLLCQNIEPSKKYYKTIGSEIHRIGRKKHLNIIDAF